jgi:checkpoint serine/threonine-protein kinase
MLICVRCTESSSPSQNIIRHAAIDNAPGSCDPLLPEQISDILNTSSTPLTSIEGFRDHRNQTSSKLGALQRIAQSRRKSSHNASHSRASAAHEETAWQLELDQDVFSVREKLGEGGFGSVFRVAELLEDVAEDDDEDNMKQTALKIESPPNLWEFYIITLLHNRLPERTRGSVVQAYRLYAFQDESHLLLDYCDQGSLLDAVNHAHDAGIGPAGTVSTGLEEVLAIFFTIELTRILECFHTYRFIHGDFKIDNCLIRLDDVPGGAARNWSSAYKADGTGGWKHKGVTIIDFGRTVDLDHFEPGQTFTTEVKTDKHDCPEVAEGRPWLYQPDYYGLACIAHVLLFGKYLETVQTGEDSRTGLPKQSIKEPLKRYHQASLWNRFFDLLLNPTSFTEGDPSKPITHLLKDSRHDMERWLEANSDKNGKSLKGLLKKLEIWALSRQ